MITVNPQGFRIVKKQNELTKGVVDYEKARKQHAALVKALGAVNVAPKWLPDEVFVANAALPLPMLPVPVFLLSNFKYAQRKPEAYNLAPFLEQLGEVVEWPFNTVLEGQGEVKWFIGGKVAVVGYGFRSTKQSVADLETVLTKIYASANLPAPMVLGVKLLDARFYHLDIAASAISNDECLIQEGAIDSADIQKMEALGIRCTVRSFGDAFALNSVSRYGNYYTHILTPKARGILKSLGLNVVELDVSEFEKSGGGVRCMVLALY
jgi:N-dimethylarginine dimethylaminohydrolase